MRKGPQAAPGESEKVRALTPRPGGASKASGGQFCEIGAYLREKVFAVPQNWHQFEKRIPEKLNRNQGQDYKAVPRTRAGEAGHETTRRGYLTCLRGCRETGSPRRCPGSPRRTGARARARGLQRRMKNVFFATGFQAVKQPQRSQNLHFI